MGQWGRRAVDMRGMRMEAVSAAIGIAVVVLGLGLRFFERAAWSDRPSAEPHPAPAPPPPSRRARPRSRTPRGPPPRPTARHRWPWRRRRTGRGPRCLRNGVRWTGRAEGPPLFPGECICGW